MERLRRDKSIFLTETTIVRNQLYWTNVYMILINILHGAIIAFDVSSLIDLD